MNHPVDALPNFHAVLHHWAQEHPQRVAFHFLPEGDAIEASLTFGGLDRRARALAAVLQERGWEGSPLLLQYRPGLDFIVAFFACLYAGAIAVPAYPPTGNRSKSERLRTLAASCDAKAVLTNAATRPDLERDLGDAAGLLPLLCTDEPGLGDAGAWHDRQAGAGQVAFLQYSSGSTGDPKGVIITHGNLMHNQQAIRSAMGNGPHTVFASWLPLFHDMGLVGNVMQPLYLGVSCFLMPPMAFLQKPLRWLEVISRHRVTCTGGPNFAYDLCVDKVSEAQREGLDLSSWDIAYNGSEVVRARTVQRFVEAYRPHGLPAHAAYPCYGLAEGTLLVTGPPRGTPWRTLDLDGPALARGDVVHAAGSAAPGVRSVTSCGVVQSGQSVRIVDPATGRTCPPGRVGEIWLRGPSIAAGYWRRPDLDAQLFAPPADAPDAGRHCRTGDLGFMAGGELYITGRLKEVLIVRGRNHYPQDIEHTVQSAWPGFQRGGGAVFQVGEEGERLVLVQEIARAALRNFDPAHAERLACEAVAREHGLAISELVAIKPATLARTSSGKIRRGAMRDSYLRGGLVRIAAAAPAVRPPVPPAASGAGFALLQQELAAMGVPAAALSAAATLPQLGLDSLQIVDLQSRLARQVSDAPTLEMLFSGPSLGHLAATLSARSAGPAEDDERAQQGQAPGSDARLTPYQLAIWLHQQQTAAPIYNLGIALEFDASADADRLVAALQDLLRRHPHLSRCVRADAGGIPCWLPATAGPVERTRIDGWSEARLDDALRAFRARPFRLEEEPPLRAWLLERETGGPMLALCAHHLALDFQGACNLLDEWLQGTPPADASLAGRSVIDAPARLHAMAAGAAAPHEAWLDRLAGASAEIDLGVAAPRSGAWSDGAPAEVAGTLDADLLAAVRQAASHLGTTLNVLLASAFAALLHRYSGQASLCIGMPVTARPEALAHWPGHAVNMVPLAFEFTAEDDTAALAARAVRAVTDGLHHRHVPLMRVAEGVRRRQPGRRHLFDAVFSCQPPSRTETSAAAALLAGSDTWQVLPRSGGDLRVRSRRIAATASQALLTLLAVPGPGGLRVTLEFDPARVPAGFAAQVLGHYDTLLRSLVRSPRTPLREVPCLTDMERHTQWVAWNAGGRIDIPDSRAEGGLVRRFLEQAEARPSATAVLDAAGAAFSYDELAAAAQRLRATLQRHGVAPGDCVGIALPRDRMLPAAILGVLMCGAAYVPLDLDYPVERLRHILASSGTRHVLTVPAHAHEFTRAGALCVCPNPAEPAAAGTVWMPRPDDLAYVLYTSGSTGQPKGVQVTHANVLALLAWARDTFTPAERMRVLASTSVCFDLSVFEFFVPLCLGTTCVVVPRILDLVDAAPAGVTMINTVPSAIEALLAAGAIPASVTTALVAGEPFRQVLVDRLYDESRVRRVLDLYGPTEDTVYSTAAERQPRGRETIGRPLPGTRAYVLDAAGQPVPIGVAGELYLAGAGLSRGYRGRDDLTAAAFVVPASIAHLEARAYRTGDIVRLTADGELVYLGRRDQQVKVHGYRIELQEIEAALASHPAVREAVAHVVATPRGQPLLAAYVAWHDGPGAGASGRPALESHLIERLPHYMRPAVVMTLEQLPRTLNGKVDRRALPPCETAAEAPAPLAGADETALADAWAEAISTAPTRHEDHFVEMGGNSLGAVRLRAALQQRFSLAVPLAVLLATPVFGRQLGLLRQLRAAASPGYTPGADTPPAEAAPVEEFEL